MLELVTCPHCGKRNPLRAPASAKIDTCQWCHKKYELTGDGQAVAPSPPAQRVVLPAAAKEHLDVAKKAYAVWVDGYDDLFPDEESDGTTKIMQDAIGAVADIALAAGIGKHELDSALRYTFPSAAGFEFFETAMKDPIGVVEPDEDEGGFEFSESFIQSPRAAASVPVPCVKCGAALPAAAKYCLACGEAVPEPDSSHQVAALRQEVAHLRGQVESLLAGVEEVRLPQTDLLSESFWTRALAVFGHGLAFQVALIVVMYVVIFAIVGAVAVTQ